MIRETPGLPCCTSNAMNRTKLNHVREDEVPMSNAIPLGSCFLARGAAYVLRRSPWVKTHKLQVGAGDGLPAQQRQKDSEVRRVRSLGGNTRRGKEGAVSLHWPEPHTHHWSLPETHPARGQPGFLWTLELGHTEGQGGGEEAEKTGRTLVGALRLLLQG